MSHVGNLFKQRRVERNLTFGQLARMVGYENLSRGSNRIQAFERGGKVAPDLLEKLVEALEIDHQDVRRMAAEDYRDWLAWANEPVRPYLVLRYMACVYQRIELPDDLLEPEAAEAYASQVAKMKRLMVCLVL
ncbi:helix-turn-helix domain-containing protein, partial [Tautonia marina]|uniref:helix-turn-helix domain-containing protein n=1 Tax=Tautonia marina TaxID=2653855 RepID=UPI001260CD88